MTHEPTALDRAAFRLRVRDLRLSAIDELVRSVHRWPHVSAEVFGSILLAVGEISVSEATAGLDREEARAVELDAVRISGADADAIRFLLTRAIRDEEPDASRDDRRAALGLLQRLTEAFQAWARGRPRRA